MATSTSALPLRSELTCPHCWHRFPPENICWIAEHSDLQGDPVTGPESALRFIPTQFNVDCNAIDARGEACKKLACPKCHLGICRSLLELEPLFVSILGAPSSGKSFYITSMIHQLESTLQLGISVGDADPDANEKLTSYKELLFRSDTDSWVKLEKTQTEGDLYEAVMIGDRPVRYPKPFVYSVQPTRDHPQVGKAKKLSRALCLYDNAGEHFLPGGVSSTAPVTQHLGLSSALLFLFDPTQEPEFRAACRGRTSDPQMGEYGKKFQQDLVLSDAARRIRDQTKLSETQMYDKPLIVVVTKYDAWAGLTSQKRLDDELAIRTSPSGSTGLRVSAIEKVSEQIRGILAKHASGVVAAAERFASDVTYIPVSSIGCTPKVVSSADGHDDLLVRAGDIHPMWAQVPMLYALHKTVDGLVPVAKSSSRKNSKSQSPERRKSPPLNKADDAEPREWKETGS